MLRHGCRSNEPRLYAGAFCKFVRKTIIIWDAELVSDCLPFCAVPQQVTLIGDGFIEVGCGPGMLRNLCAEYQGKATSPSLFIHSIRKRLT